MSVVFNWSAVNWTEKTDWSLFKSFVNLQQWEENNLCVTYTKNMETVINMYEIYYCACIYEAWAIFFTFIFNLWLNLLIIYFVIQEPLLNEGRQFVNKSIKQLWIKFSNPSSEFIVHKSWHGIPCFFLFLNVYMETCYHRLQKDKCILQTLIKDQNFATFICQIMLFFKSMFTFFVGEVGLSRAFVPQEHFLSSHRKVCLLRRSALPDSLWPHGL